MIEINLLPPEFQKKAKKEFKLPELPYLRIFGVLAVVFIGIESLLFAGVLLGKSRLAELGQRLKILSPDFERLKAVKLETSRLESELAALDVMTERKFYWTSLLNAVSDSVTESVWLTHAGGERKVVEFDLPKKNRAELKEEEEKQEAADAKTKKKRTKRNFEPEKGRRVDDYLVIRGSAPVTGQGTAAVGRFIQSLKESPVIMELASEVKLDKLERINEDTLFDFTISGKLKVPLGASYETF